MCDTATVMGVSLALQGVGTLFGAKNQKEAGAAKKGYYEYLAGTTEKQAVLVEDVSNKQQKLVQDQAMRDGRAVHERGVQVDASQRAAMAANGIAGGATAEDVTRDTFSKEKLDEMAVRYTADMKNWEIGNQTKMKTWDLRNQAQQYRYAGDVAAMAGDVDSTATLLGGAATVSNTWANWSKAR